MASDDERTGYFSAVRIDVIELFDGSNLRVLEIGCGSGETGAALLAQGVASHVTGVEVDAEAAGLARKRLTHVITANVEQLDLTEVGQKFDVVLMADVIEHLIDPWATLRRVRDELLEPNGTIIASIPNARCLAVWAPLALRGSFTYRASGLLDRTHLRWFTRSSIVDMFAEIDMTIELVKVRRLYDSKGRAAKAMMVPLRDFAVMQFLVRAGRHSRTSTRGDESLA